MAKLKMRYQGQDETKQRIHDKPKNASKLIGLGPTTQQELELLIILSYLIEVA